MEAIFELLFGNFLIVALLIGGLISLFNRNKGGGDQSDRRSEQREVDWKSIFQQEEKSTSEQRPTKPVPEAEAELVKPEVSGNDQYTKQVEELRKKQEQARELAEKTGGTSAARPPRRSKLDQNGSRTVNAGITPLTPEKARQGIIWSEILGEPKSRRQHSNYGRKQYQKRRG